MQYLGEKELLENIDYFDVKDTDLISSDSYNEEEIMKKFNLFDKKAKELLLKCAIHIAVIGYGNKTFGMIRDGDKVYDISALFSNYGIVYNRNINEKYEKDTLSARRLVRLLRYHIQKFIIQTGRPSYLWLKYSDKDKSSIPYCFPGGEHLVKTDIEAIYMMKVYSNLDVIFGSRFQIRLQRVFVARGLLRPISFVK